MAINKATLAKEIDGVIEYIYPKTSGDIVVYDETHSVNAMIQSLLQNKVDKEDNKGLSTNDFTNTLKAKLDGISDNANAIVLDSALSESSANGIQNKVVAARFIAADTAIGEAKSAAEAAADAAATANSGLAALKNTVDNLELGVPVELTNKVDTTATKVSTLEGTVGGHTTSIETLTTEVGTAKSTAASAKSAADKASQDVTNLRVDMNNLEVGVPAAVTQKIDSNTNRIVVLENRIKEAEITLDMHNTFYRGKDLTNVYTLDQIYDMVMSGTFADLWVGDYITKTITTHGVTEEMDFIFAGFNTMMGVGDTGKKLDKNHIVVVMRDCFKTTQRINASNTTSGGILGSEFFNSKLGGYNTGLKNVFGVNHVIKHNVRLGNAPSGSWVWTDVESCLMCEKEIFNVKTYSNNWDNNDGLSQIPLFKLKPELRIAKLGKTGSAQWWWEHDVSTHNSGSGLFCYVSTGGAATNDYASGSGGVRLRFLIG